MSQSFTDAILALEADQIYRMGLRSYGKFNFSLLLLLSLYISEWGPVVFLYILCESIQSLPRWCHLLKGWKLEFYLRALFSSLTAVCKRAGLFTTTQVPSGLYDIQCMVIHRALCSLSVTEPRVDSPLSVPDLHYTNHIDPGNIRNCCLTFDWTVTAFRYEDK